MIGSFEPLISRSPINNEFTCTVGTVALPVTACSRIEAEGSGVKFRIEATRAMMHERLAPVSSTRRKGPRSLMYTGAQMRPIRSRRVGDT
jgi:hypothetical protein